MKLGALISKMHLLVTIIRGGLTQVLVLPVWWPAAVLVISSRRIGCIDLCGWGRAWKSWATRVTITTTSSIAPIVSMVLLRPVRGFDILGIMRKLGSRLLQPGKVLFEDFFLNAFVRFGGRSMTLKAASIYFLHLRQKIESGVGPYGNGLVNGLLPDVLLIAILLGLGTNEEPKALANQANQDWLRDHYVSIEFLENRLYLL